MAEETRPADAGGTGAARPMLEIDSSRQLLSWLREQKLSIAFSTYQAGKLFLLGLSQDDKLSVHERSFERCMGLAAVPGSLYMATLYQIWRMNNILDTGAPLRDGVDQLYVPQASWVTGDVDTHDLAIDADGRLVFVNTLFSCLATVDPSASFAPIWHPPFISRLAAEDRCHLNGLAMKDGRPAWVTAVSTTDIHEGWREHRRSGGVVIDVHSGHTVCEGLSMPHSPRWHNGQLYVLNSGCGDFGRVNLDTGRFEPICFLPGYARGLSLHGDFALIGLSKPRVKSFEGLELQERLEAKNVKARCGIAVVDLRNGDLAHSINIDGVIDELYDVVALPGIRTPSALGFKSEEIRRTIRMAPGPIGSASATEPTA